MVDFGSLVVHLQDTGRALARLFKGRFEKLLVNVDAMEVVIVLSLSVLIIRTSNTLSHTVPNLDL